MVKGSIPSPVEKSFVLCPMGICHIAEEVFASIHDVGVWKLMSVGSTIFFRMAQAMGPKVSVASNAKGRICVRNASPYDLT
jgi:hypothetical protein